MKRLHPALVLLVLFFTTHANGQLWKEYADSASALRLQNKYADAIIYFNRSLTELKKDSSGTYTYGTVLDNLGGLYSNMSQNDKAESILIEEKEVWEKLGNQPEWVATAWCNLALLYRNVHQYQKSETYYLEAKQILEKGDKALKEKLTYARACDELGILYQIIKDYDQAEPLLLEGIRIREKISGKGSEPYAKSCDNLGIFYSSTSRYNIAESYMLEARQAWVWVYNSRESQSYAISCNNLGYLYKKTGQFRKAEELYLESKEIRAKTLPKNHPQNARSFENLGFLYQEMGQYEKAELLLLEAKRIIELAFENQVNPRYASICISLGILYMNMGQYEKAESFDKKSIEIVEKVYPKNPLNYVESYNNLAVVYTTIGQYDKAEDLYVKAKNILEKQVSGKENYNYVLNCLNLGSLYALKGDYEKAGLFTTEAKDIWKKIADENHPTFAQICITLAFLYKEMGQYEKAELLYLDANRIKANILGKEHFEYVQGCLALADLYWVQKNFEKANEYYAEAFRLQNLVKKKVFHFTNEIEKQYYIKKDDYLEKKILSFNVSSDSHDQPGFAYNISLTGRNLILSSSQQLRQSIYSSRDTTVKNKYNEWMNVREQLSFWYAKPIAEREGHLKILEEKSGVLEKDLIRLSAEFRNVQAVKEPDWKIIQQSLQPGEAAIEFVEFQYFNGTRWTDSTYYIALVLKKNSPKPELVNLFEKKQLDSLLSYKKTSAAQHKLTALYSKNKDAGGEKVQTLYEVIWKPLEKKLDGIKTIYFAPAGILYKIAFAALPVSNSELLSDKYQLVQLNTTSSLTNKSMSRISLSDRIVLYGGVHYDADSASIKQAALQTSSNDLATRSVPEDLLREGVTEFYPLPGSVKEVNELGKLGRENKYKIEVSAGIKATEESFKTLSGKNSPNLLHVSTHGFFFPDPKNNPKDEKLGGEIVFRQSDNPLIRSGLAFAGANNAWKGKSVAGVEDGILTSYEVSNMHFPNTTLAVLSACETGLGDIQGSEGVYGLQRAFKMAGVQNLLMSLWRVDDELSSEFMQEFYRNLFNKKTISTAFYITQELMRNKYRNDPYKWAAWVLIR